MTITLTDGGIETRSIYEFKYAIDDFESFELLEDQSGTRHPSADLSGLRGRRGSIWITDPAWHSDVAASRKWTNDVARVNAAAVELVCEVAQHASGARIIVAGVFCD
jgi:hypothetical protein